MPLFNGQTQAKTSPNVNLRVAPKILTQMIYASIQSTTQGKHFLSSY